MPRRCADSCGMVRDGRPEYRSRQLATCLCSGTFPYVTESMTTSSSSGVALRARSMARTSSTPCGHGQHLSPRLALPRGPQRHGPLTGIRVDDDAISGRHGDDAGAGAVWWAVWLLRLQLSTGVRYQGGWAAVAGRTRQGTISELPTQQRTHYRRKRDEVLDCRTG